MYYSVLEAYTLAKQLEDKLIFEPGTNWVRFNYFVANR